MYEYFGGEYEEFDGEQEGVNSEEPMELKYNTMNSFFVSVPNPSSYSLLAI